MARKINPIDEDKVAKNPGLLPYAHHMGSAIIKPIDKGKVKGLAMSAMYEQTEEQLVQIKDQVELLVRQAQMIHDRINISEKIYKADCGFKPIHNKTYYLYRKGEDKWILSMVGHEEWGKSCPYEYLAKVTLLSDSTWKVLEAVHEELKTEIEI